MRKNTNKQVTAIVPAAGLGNRLGKGPKAFLQLENKTLLEIVTNQLLATVGHVIVAVPEVYIDFTKKILDSRVEIYSGGSSRQDTLNILLSKCSNEKKVLIHDVTRPFASASLINRVINEMSDNGAVMTYFPSQVPVASNEHQYLDQVISSKKSIISQSPQAYDIGILKSAYKYAYDNEIETQTTWQLVKMIGIQIKCILGEEENIKITTPFDWEIARKVIAPKIIRLEKAKLQ